MSTLFITQKIKMFAFIALMLLFNWVVVYLGNGTSSVLFPVFNFVIITYAAFKLGVNGGLIVGFLSGLLLGPIMPLDVTQQMAHPTYSWLMGLLIFSAYGYGMGTFILQLKNQCDYDRLTGIPNRTFFYDLLTKGSQQNPQLAKKSFYVLLINIDDFKSINDSIGHIAADLLLVDIKSRILNCLKESDVLARWSGDEFSIILYRDNVEQLTSDCDSILSSLNAPYQVKEQIFFINASMGISSINTKHHLNGILVKEAETAMRYVKAGGKNGCKFYTEEMDRNSLQQKLLEADLHSALAENQFELYYQPKIICKGKKIYGVEALIRWRKPDEGIVSPGVFIPVAEKTGLIIPIGNWVLKTACNQIKKWEQGDKKAICISVNVSALQIQEDDFVSTVSTIIEEAGIQPSLIELEITESSIMKDTIGNITKLNELKDIGLKISLDDFGKGYSSLNYLKILPIDTLKVDKSFIENIEDNPKEKVITESIIRMAKALDLTVLAEGIEKDIQYSLLQELDCDAVQGFYFSKPLPIEQLEKLLTENRIVISGT